MILVTGGRGAVATAVVDGLVAAGLPVRIGGREPSAIDAPSGVAAVPVDLTRPETLPAALDGVDKVFLYAEPSGIEAFVDAAEAAGVQQVVLLSSNSVHGSGPIAERHQVVEERLAAAGFASAFLRPSGFARNAINWWLPALAAGAELRLPHPESTDAPIDERDIGAVAVAILQAGPDGPHARSAPDLTGPASLTRRQMVETIAATLGQEARIVVTDDAQARADMAGWPPAIVDSLLHFWALSDGVPTPVSDAVERITGRPGRTYADWARETLAPANMS